MRQAGGVLERRLHEKGISFRDAHFQNNSEKPKESKVSFKLAGELHFLFARMWQWNKVGERRKRLS